MIRKFIYLLGFLFWSSMLIAQSSVKNPNYSPKTYKKEPVWIQMMDDPSANYFETLKAFRVFWEGRELPKEPFENGKMESFEREVGLIKEGESEEEHEQMEKKKRRKTNLEVERDYASQVRAFKGWIQGVKPWVLEDGSIVSLEERQRIIDQQQQELKLIEKNQGKK